MRYTFVDSPNEPHLGGNIAEGDPLTFSPTVWDYLIDRFAVRSMLDLGSGFGYAAQYFHRKGVQTIAVDGMAGNVAGAVFPTVLVDLTKQPVVCAVDLVHCQEVVEHIAPEYVNNVVQSLACGRFVVMSHAEPNQPGFHHVNCQTWEYWVEKMEAAGMHLLPVDTDRVRAFAGEDGAGHMARSGLVFARKAA